MSNLVIFDVLSVTDVNALAACLTPNTDYIKLHFHEDSFETLKQKIGNKTYQNVAIAQKYNDRADRSLVALDHLARVKDVKDIDPELKTWKEHIDFFAWLRDERGMQNLDLLECNLWADNDWKYIINTMETMLNINIRASLDITGAGGNWVLESDNTDTIGMYFTEDVKQYPHHFYQTEYYYFDQNNSLILEGSGGTMFKTKYEGHINRRYYPTFNVSGTTNGYITLPSDISNVVQVIAAQRNLPDYWTQNSHAALRSDGTVVTWGERYTFMFDRSSVYDLSLSNVKRLYSSWACVLALKNDNSVVGWGNGSYNVSTAQSIYTESTYFKAMPASVTNVKEIYINEQAYCALKYDGTVEAWGLRYGGGDCSSCQSLLVNVRKIVISVGWGGFFIALRTDGNMVCWKGDPNAGLVSGFATTIGGASAGRVLDVVGTSGGFFVILNDNSVRWANLNFYSDARGYGFNPIAYGSFYTIPTGVTVRSSEPFSGGNSCKLYLSNNTIVTFRSGSTFVIDSDQVLTNLYGGTFPIYQLNRNGSVSVNATIPNYGPLNDATYGLPAGADVSSNVVQIYNSEAGAAARKADGTFVSWGSGINGWPLRFDSSANGIRDVVYVIDFKGGYKIIRSNNKLITVANPTNVEMGFPNNVDFRTTAFADLSNTTLPSNKSVWIFDNLLYYGGKELAAVELDPFESITPSTPFMRFQNTTIVYKSNNCFRLAKRGMKYGLYSGTTLISTFAPIHDTMTYTFENAQVPIIGTITLSVGLLSVNFQNTQFTFNVTTIENPFLSPPDAPSITSVSVSLANASAAVNFTLASWNGGAPVTAIKYSLDGGATFTSTSTLTSPLNLSGLVLGSYDLVLISSNLIGDSYPATSSIVMCDPPAAPTITSVVGGNRTLSVNYTHPAGAPTSSNLNVTGINSNTFTATLNTNTLLNGIYDISSSSNYSVSFQPYAAFDGCSNTIWNSGYAYFLKEGALPSDPFYYGGNKTTSVQTIGTISGEWIQIKYPNPIIMTGYSIHSTANNYYPNTFWLVGSNNGTTWYPLDNRSGQWNISVGTTYSNITPQTPGSFRYFRFIVTVINQGWWYRMNNFTIIGYPVASNTITGYKYSLNGGAFILSNSLASPIVINQLTNGTTYNVALRAVNAAGDSASSNVSSNISLTPVSPDAPVLSSATVGNQSITFQYTIPYNGGSAITGVQYSLNGGAYVSLSPMSSPFTINGLTNGSTYSLKLRATNSIGTSAISNEITGLVPKSFPFAPTITSITPSNGTLICNYTPGNDGGSPITGYKYSFNGGAYQSTPDNSGQIERTGLVNGTSYSFQLIAINAVGESSPSALSSGIPYTTPSAPVITSISAVNGSASIAFTQGSNGGNAITEYEYSFDSQAETPLFVAIPDGDVSSPVSITGLTNGTAYSVVLRAKNAAGVSSISNLMSFTPLSIPNAPIINSVSYGNGSATLDFSADTVEGDSAITGYKLSQNNGSFVSIGLVSSPYTITGLTNGTTYSFRLIATTSIGDTASSLASEDVIPRRVPDAPVISISETDLQVSVSFTQGASTGGSAITSFVYSYDGGDEVTLSAPETQTYSLVLGQSYSFSVYCINDAGSSPTSTISFIGKSVPDAPVIDSVVARNKSAKIVFTAGSANNSAITGYKYKLDNGSWVNATLDASGHVLITGLTENVEYSVTLSAINAIGQSLSSNAMSVVPYTTPAAPTINSIVPGNGTATISITAGADNSSEITTFKYSLNNGAYISLPDLSTLFYLSDLSNGILYNIKVKTTNAAGDSASASQNFMPYTVPEAPVITSVTAGNEEAEVYFIPGFFNGSNITGYKYALNGGDYDGTTFVDANEINSPIHISGLVNGTVYTVNVVAVNAAGESNASNSSSSFAPFITQSTANPPLLQSVSVGNQSASIQYVDDYNPGSAIIGYKHSLNGAPYLWFAQNSSPLQLTGLENGTEYTMYVKAVNNSGASAASLPITFTPCAEPSAPIILNAVGGDGQMTLYIEESDPRGSAITYVHCSLNGGEFFTVDVSGGQILLEGLDNGTEYVAVLKSENAIGMSDESNASETVIPVGLPFPPSITNIVVGDRQLTVEFSAADGNGSEILKYSYCLIANGVAGLYLSTEDLSSPIVIEGLTNGVEYSIRMKSLTKQGESAPTNESETFMPFGLPEAPIITGTFFENGILSVHFSEQGLNGKPVVDHLYSLDEGTTFFSSSQTTSPLSIPNLEIGATTTVCIKTITEAGSSTVSNISPEIMAYTAPTSPVITSITSQNKALTVNFVDGDFNGTVKIGYKYKLNDDVNFYWCNTDVSPIVIAGLENGTPYTVSMKVVTNQGDSDVYTFATPVIPSNLQLPPAIISVDSSNNSIVVSFKNPELNGATITGYQYAVNDGSFLDVSASNWDISNNKITITGLSNGTSYTVALKSVSSNGISASSNISKSVSPYTNPSPPVISRVVTGSQIANVFFTDGSLNGSPAILGYKYSLDGTNYIWSSVTSSPIPLTGLTNNLAYTVRVMAVTSVNSSAPSAASALFVPFTLPEPPTINSVSVSNGTATISYTAGATNGRPFTGYSYSLNGGASVAIGLNNPFTISGLTNGLTYLATMRSVNAAGSSVSSAPSPAFVPYTVPGAPVITSIVPSNGALTVNVSNPSLNGIIENGINIIGYSYSFNNSTFTFVPTANNATSFNITGLVNGTTYQVYVRSATDLGVSVSSNPVSGAPRTTPSPVTITSVTAGNKSVSVAFVAGTSNGAAITGYKYSLDGTNYITASQTASPISIFNLINGVSYNVFIRATNAAGDSSASLISPSFMPFASLTPPLITSIASKNMGATINVNNTYFGTVDGSGISILGYQYSFNDLSYIQVDTTNPTSFDISGLNNGSSYQIYVKTITNIGTSSKSLQSNLFFARSAPDAPTITSVEASDSRVLLSFTDGSNNGSAITGYKYSLDGTTYYTALQKTSPLTLFSLDNATSYQVYLKAVNAMGDSSNSNLSDAVVPFGNPFAPVVTKVVPGNGCAYVHFEPINTNGSPITKIKYTLGAAAMDAIGIESPVTIPNLTNKLVYNVSIIATNLAGDSYASNSLPVIVGSPTVPEVTSIVAGAKSVRVFFEMPNDNGMPITQFSYTTVGSNKYTKALGLTSPLTIAGLTNGTPYNIVIAAVNKNGQSLDSTPMGNRTPFDIPGKFTITSVVPRFNGAAINFALPAINGSAITKYAYSMNSTDPISSFIDLSGTTSPLQLEGIPNNTTYSIRLVAYNEAGPSPITVASKPVSFKYLPPAVPKITGVTPAFQKLFVNFVAPVINGAPITTYKYALNNSTTYIDASTNTIPLMIPIDNNVSYTVKIIACSAAGDSAPSAASAAASFVYLPPAAPLVTNIIAGNQSASIVFTAPKTNGADITGYKYSLNGGTTKIDLSGLVSPLTITGLTNDVSYNVLMYADSGAGLSPPSAVRPVIPMYAVPAAPSIKTVVVSEVNASIGYTLGSANGAPITSVLYSLGTGEFTDTGSINGSFVLTGLTSKQAYSIRLIAVNEVGQSLPTAPRPFTMK